MNLKKILIPLSISFLLAISNSCRQSTQHGNISILSADTLSTNGSTRATAYLMSNKIITARGKIFVGWLDMLADIQIKEYDIETGRWSQTILLGQGVDSHSGPALTMDSDGYLYAVFGPHHGPFQFRKSLKPYQINEWGPIEHFGDTATYPSLLCDKNDNLHITYRGGREPWRLMYQQKPKNGDWSEPRELVDSTVEEGYTQYGNPITLSNDNTLHLVFHIYDMHPARGKSLGYLKSADGGKTWQNARGEDMVLPVTPESNCFIEQGPQLDMRVGNIIADKNNLPWLTAVHLEKKPATAFLWHFDGTDWKSTPLLRFIENAYPDWGFLQCNLTMDMAGVIYLFSVIQKNDAEIAFGDPSAELILLTSTDSGKTFSVVPISRVDPENCNWLPSVERPYTSRPVELPALLYTHGRRGISVTEGEPTDVIFMRLGHSNR